MQALFGFLALGMSHEWAVSKEEEEEEASSSSPKQIIHFTNTLEHAHILFEMYGKWARIHEFSIII